MIDATPSTETPERNLGQDISGLLSGLLQEKQLTQKELAVRMAVEESDLIGQLASPERLTVSELARLMQALGEECYFGRKYLFS